MRTEIKIEKIEDFKKFVDSIIIDTKYTFPLNSRYKWVEVRKEKGYNSEDEYYSWTVEYRYEVSGCVGYIYPIKSGNLVQGFKTESGAKRSLYKMFKSHFDSLNYV